MKTLKTENNNTTLNMCLCKGRHEIPQAVEGSVFPTVIENMTETEMLEDYAFRKLWNACFKKYKAGECGYLRVADSWDGYDETQLEIDEDVKLNLYVTGLTVALIAVLNVCRKEGIKVTLYHYNTESGDYFPQEVL